MRPEVGIPGKLPKALKGCPHRRIRPLGEGAVGDVHLCVDVHRRRLVVVKWLRAEVHEGSEAAKRFTREAARMAGRTFDGVIKVEDYGSDEFGRTWMAMEFVDGISPGGVIDRGNTWGVFRLLEGVGRSLDELHGLGVVHRDLKPDNLILRNVAGGWDPVIIDLGIAKWLAHEVATATGSVFGTPHYMSPEQFKDTKHVGPATDRYALAVIGFELLTQKLPYDGSTLPELLHQHMESSIPQLQFPDPNDAAKLRPVPRLDEFMAVAMAKAPNDRFGTGREMADAFRDAAAAEGLWDPPQRSTPLFDPLLRPVLEIRPPGGAALRYDMRDGPVVVGRHEACQVVLTSPRLSRLHSCIYTHRGRIWVADLNSQNGTRYEDKALAHGTSVPLRTDGRPAKLVLYDQVVEVIAHHA